MPGPRGARGAHKGPAHKGPGVASRARTTRAQVSPQGPRSQGPKGPLGGPQAPGQGIFWHFGIGCLERMSCCWTLDLWSWRILDCDVRI